MILILLNSFVQKKPLNIGIAGFTQFHVPGLLCRGEKGDVKIVGIAEPMAVNPEHAKKMGILANKYHIKLLTNYETSWYLNKMKVFEFLNKDTVGILRKDIFRNGYREPKKICVPPRFFQWLTDPVQDGGGAIIDFGCYGEKK